MRDWAVGQAGGNSYSWAALSSNDSKTLYSRICPCGTVAHLPCRIAIPSLFVPGLPGKLSRRPFQFAKVELRHRGRDHDGARSGLPAHLVLFAAYGEKEDTFFRLFRVSKKKLHLNKMGGGGQPLLTALLRQLTDDV